MSKERPRHHFSLENIVRLARENVLKDGSHIPTIIAQGDSGVVIAGIEDMPGTHAERCRGMASTGFTMAQSGKIGRLRQLFFITEGWMSVPNRGQLPDCPPSQDPNRLEVLLIENLKVMEHEENLIIFEMIRNDDGRLTNLKQLEPPGEGETTVKSPLLHAFVQGYGMGTNWTAN